MQTHPNPASTDVGTTSLHSAGRLNARQDLVGNKAGVGASAVGVELHPLGFAPHGEIVRVQVHAHDPDSFCLKTFAAGFGGPQPLIVGPMEFVTILEHGHEPFEVLPLEPHHAGGQCHNGAMAVDSGMLFFGAEASFVELYGRAPDGSWWPLRVWPKASLVANPEIWNQFALKVRAQGQINQLSSVDPSGCLTSTPQVDLVA